MVRAALCTSVGIGHRDRYAELREVSMKAVAGDVITVDSEKVDVPPRSGTVLEVLEAPYGTRYRVRWHDGHESTIHPMAGTAHFVSGSVAVTAPATATNRSRRTGQKRSRPTR
jgi:hypothetical protein